MFSFMRQLRRPWPWILGLVFVCIGAGGIWWQQQNSRSALRFSTPGGATPDLGEEPRVVRGPYLQRLTPTGVVIRWRTDVPAQAAVAFAPLASTQAPRVQVVPGARTDHQVELSQLTPATTYSYDLLINNAPVQGKPQPWQFDTWPVGSPAEPVRVWVLGDSGTASPGARAVMDAYLRYARQRLPHVWLMLGDNAYNSGTDLEFQAAVFDMYAAILPRICVWPTRGNHEKAGVLGRVPYFEIFTMPTQGEAGGVPSQTQSYYAFDYGDIHFVNLDSYATDRSAQGPMATWLKQDLQQSRARWRIVYFHHPPYSRGTHNSDKEKYMVQMRNNLLPILEAAGVDLVLTGHSHNYERSGLMAGHYGPSDTYKLAYKLASGGRGAVFRKQAGPRGGTVYVVAGASGELGRRYHGLDHPAMDVSSATLGSLVLNVDHDQIEATYLASDATVFDRFTLLAPPPLHP